METGFPFWPKAEIQSGTPPEIDDLDNGQQLD
jgi:hypothetical protein